MNPYLEKTLASCKYSLPHFEDVSIDFEKLRNEAVAAATGEFRTLSLAPEAGVIPSSDRAFVSHCFFWNVVNFCFDSPDPRPGEEGKLFRFLRTDQSGKLRNGAMAMYSCFWSVFGDNPISTEGFRRIFRSDAARYVFFRPDEHPVRGVIEIPLVAERWQMLDEAVAILDEKFRGDPFHILEEGRFRAFGTRTSFPGVVDLLLKEFPGVFGSDFASCAFAGDWRHFFFAKRAQLFAWMYHCRAVQSKELPPIADIEDVGPFPDYQLPRSYAHAGIFRYSDRLTEIIRSATPIPAKSRMEVEIRAATVFAQAKEREVMNAIRSGKNLPPLSLGQIDAHRFMGVRGNPLNHHITYTTDY